MGISRFYEEANEDFDIFGLINNEWIEFKKGIDFEGFLLKRKNNDL